MAQRMQVIFEDDLDGSEAAGTVTFALNGVGYELDLSARNRDKLLKAFGPYVEAGRKVSARPSSRRPAVPPAKRHDQSAVRARCPWTPWTGPAGPASRQAGRK